MVPNAISFLRLAASPYIAWLLASGEAILGGIIFTIAAFSDALDGFLSHLNKSWAKETALGKILDPLADRVLLSAAFIAGMTRIVPVSLILIYIFAALAFGLCYYLMVRPAGLTEHELKRLIQPNIFGKAHMTTGALSVLSAISYPWWSGAKTAAFWLLLLTLVLFLLSNAIYAAEIGPRLNKLQRIRNSSPRKEKQWAESESEGLGGK